MLARGMGTMTHDDDKPPQASAADHDALAKALHRRVYDDFVEASQRAAVAHPLWKTDTTLHGDELGHALAGFVRTMGAEFQKLCESHAAEIVAESTGD